MGQDESMLRRRPLASFFTLAYGLSEPVPIDVLFGLLVGLSEESGWTGLAWPRMSAALPVPAAAVLPGFLAIVAAVLIPRRRTQRRNGAAGSPDEPIERGRWSLVRQRVSTVGNREDNGGGRSEEARD